MIRLFYLLKTILAKFQVRYRSLLDADSKIPEVFFFFFLNGATKLSRYFQFVFGMKEVDVSFLAGDLE